MKSLVSKFAGLLLMTLVLSGSFVAPAQAANTGAYQWTDISSQLSERQNRPVWAIAYAAPYWYSTDGQELYSGGHVWRTDGTYVADITTEVRNAGLSRVDDIVANGSDIVFLKNVFRLDNAVEAVTLRNGYYSNPTNQLRQALDSNEGISTLVGTNNGWFMVTTRARFVRLSADMTSYSRYSVPSNTIQSYSYSSNNLLYSNQHRKDRNPSIVAAATANNTILIAVNQDYQVIQNGAGEGNVDYYTADTSNITKIQRPAISNNDTVYAMASNGQTILVLTDSVRAGGRNGSIATYTNGSWQVGSNSSWFETSCYSPGSANCSPNFFPYNNSNFSIEWDGTQWLILSGKKIYAFDANGFSSPLELRDYFVTAASNGNGTVLFGGTESSIGNNQPNFPLVAKLVKAQYGYSNNNNTGSTGSFGGNRTYTSSNGPTVTTSGNPSNFIVGNGKNFVYRVTATDPQGIDRIDLYVNGARIKTCFSDVCEFDNTYYTNGASSRSVTFMTRVTDRSGWSTESSNEYLTIDQSSNGASSGSTGSGSVTNGATNLWDWVTPSVTSIKRSETVTYGAGAWNSNGLNRVELWVNGTIRRTCTSSSDMNNCTTVLYGSDYGVGSTLSFNAKAVASNGQETWTSLRSLYVNSDSSTNTGNNNSNGYINTWSNPDVTTLSNGASAVFTANATDYDGLNRVEILKDGSVVKTCYATSYGNTTITCDYTVASSSNGSAAFSARLFDVYNNQVTSNSRTYTFTNSNGSNNGGTTNGQTSIWDWIDPNMTSMNRNQSLTYHVGAWNANGLNRVELWVNGTIRKTCSGNTQDCAFTINGSDYSANANVAFNARAIDGNGTETWTTLRNLYVSDSGTNTGGTTYGATGFYTLLVPGSQWMQFGANIQNPINLNRVELWVNGTIRKTCSMSELNKIDSQTYQCLIADFGKDYPANTKSSFAAHAVYTNGQETWTDVKYSCVIASCADESSNSTGTITVSSNRDTGYYSTSYITITAKGSDADGVAKIEVLVNGSLQKTCNNLTSCSTTVGPFGSLKTVSYMARMTDKKGNVVKTAYTIINHR